jgi:putative ABC transport system substrate-binding protein
MIVTIGRRELLAALSGATVWPLAAHAQQAAMPVVGFLGTTSMATTPSFVAAFRQGLKENAYVEGQNWVRQALHSWLEHSGD